MIEKRMNKRSSIELAASYGIGEDPRAEREARISNISFGGFCFTSDNKLRIGETLQLAIDLDTTEETIITVKVVWIKKIEKCAQYTVGVQIIENEGPEYDCFIEFYNSLQ